MRRLTTNVHFLFSITIVRWTDSKTAKRNRTYNKFSGHVLEEYQLFSEKFGRIEMMLCLVELITISLMSLKMVHLVLRK